MSQFENQAGPESTGSVRKLTLTAALAVALSGSMAGCALLKTPPPPRDTFEITAPSNFSGLRSESRAQLLVKLPRSLKSIDSDRIIQREDNGEITYVTGVQWSDNVPKMVQAKMVEAFENTGATGATAKPGDGLVIDYQLISDIRRFEVTARGEALIEMSIKLLADKSGKVLETRIFKATAPSRGSDAAAYVAAFDRAFNDLSRGTIRWVLGAV